MEAAAVREYEVILSLSSLPKTKTMRIDGIPTEILQTTKEDS